jgi:hypothetical protein
LVCTRMVPLIVRKMVSFPEYPSSFLLDLCCSVYLFSV